MSETVTKYSPDYYAHRHEVELESGAAGQDAVDTMIVGGLLRKIVINPDGTAVPSASWDLSIAGPDGEILYVSTTLSNSVTIEVPPATIAPNPCFGTITLTGANMGNSKKAVVALIFTKE